MPSFREIARQYEASEISARGAVDVLKEEMRIRINAQRRYVVGPAKYAGSVLDKVVLQVSSNYLNKCMATSYLRQIQRGIQYAVGLRRVSLLIAHSTRFRDALPRDAMDLPLQGILLVGRFHESILRQYEKRNVPTVLVDHPGEKYQLHSVEVDNETAAFDATRRLIDRGHRRIAFVRPILVSVKAVDPDARARQRGYQKALDAAGLGRNVDLIANIISGKGGRSPAIQNLFKFRPRVTAVITNSEAGAYQIESAAHARGLVSPRDLSIVCFQESKRSRTHFSGPRVEFDELGVAALQLLDEPKTKPRHLRIGTIWEEGHTLGDRI